MDRSGLAAQLETHLHRDLLPFWCGPALDHEHGGWLAWLGNDLTADRSKPKGLVLQSRILWAFSAAYRARPEPVYRAMAERAFDYLRAHFWDPDFGGAYWQVDAHGGPAVEDKYTYGQAFLIYGLTEFHRAFTVSEALDRARDTFERIERQARDPRFGGYAERCARDWSLPGRGGWLRPRAYPWYKTMNTSLHVLEAYTNLHRVAPSAAVASAIGALLGLFHRHIFDPRTAHLRQVFDRRWRSRSDGYTFGHDIESSWLLCEAAQVLGDPVELERARGLALRLARSTLTEGLAADGGLYHDGRAGHVVDRGRECWCQAEALVGFWNAFELCGDPRFDAAARATWQFIDRCLVDRTHGEWFWRITPEGHVDPQLPKVSEWKGPYHATRACLEGLKRLARFSRRAP